MNFSSNTPAGVVQSILPLHQFSIKRFLPFADPKKIKALLNQTIRYLRVRAQLPGRRQLPPLQRPALLFQKQPRRQARLAPGRIHTLPSLLHYLKR